MSINDGIILKAGVEPITIKLRIVDITGDLINVHQHWFMAYLNIKEPDSDVYKDMGANNYNEASSSITCGWTSNQYLRIHIPVSAQKIGDFMFNIRVMSHFNINDIESVNRDQSVKTDNIKLCTFY